MSERGRVEKIIENRHPLTNLKNIDPVFQSVQLGESGLAGQLDVFPATAAKGRLRLAATDQSGDTIVTVTTAAFSAARTVTIPDPGSAASFVLTAGAQALGGLLDLNGNILATEAGAGFTGGSGTIYRTSVVKMGGIIYTRILFDLTGLSSATTDLDIIGTGASVAHMGQITAARNGTILSGRLKCLELPSSLTDMDLYGATESTGVFEDIVTGLTETALLTKGGAWSAGDITELTTMPSADHFLYLVNGAADTADVFTAGKFLLELEGYDA